MTIIHCLIKQDQSVHDHDSFPMNIPELLCWLATWKLGTCSLTAFAHRALCSRTFISVVLSFWRPWSTLQPQLDISLKHFKQHVLGHTCFPSGETDSKIYKAIFKKCGAQREALQTSFSEKLSYLPAQLKRTRAAVLSVPEGIWHFSSWSAKVNLSKINEYFWASYSFSKSVAEIWTSFS